VNLLTTPRDRKIAAYKSEHPNANRPQQCPFCQSFRVTPLEEAVSVPL
jgi:hypothetical protein